MKDSRALSPGSRATTAAEARPFERALVIKLRHHGDVLLTTPVFSTLAAHGVEADALVYDDTTDVLTLNPAVARIHTVGRDWRALRPLPRLSRYGALHRTLRARRYDLIVHLTDHWHGATLARMLRPRCAVAPACERRSGLAGRFWRSAFNCTYPVLPGNRRHTVEMHLDALRRIGIRPAASGSAITFVPGTEAEAAIGRALSERGIARRGYVVVHPTSRWQFKTWPVERMAPFIDALTARGERVVLTSAPAPAELERVAALRSRLAQPVADLSGTLSLKELGALIAGARAFVGMDSVPMHIAAALGTPTVALFGPSGDVEWGPWQVPSRVVTTPFPCRPCGQDGCGGSKVSDCLTAIHPQAVLSALDDLLQETMR
jgi:heptosyltransferase-3